VKSCEDEIINFFEYKTVDTGPDLLKLF